MKELLMVLAVILAIVAVISRRNLNQILEANAQDQSPAEVENELKDQNPQSPASLNYAMAKMEAKKQVVVPAPVRPNLFGGTSAEATPAENHKASPGVAADVEKLIKQIHATPDQAFYLLQKGLAETNQPDALDLRLELLQAANGMSGDSTQIKEMAMKEISSTVIQAPAAGAPDPSEAHNLDTKRSIVSAAYQIYLSNTKDAEQTLVDTQQMLTYQQDQATRDLITYDCLSRYPQLRERLMTH